MRTRSWVASVVMTFALLESAAALAEIPGALDIAEIDRLVEKNVEKHLVGLSVGVMHQGAGSCWPRGYGVRLHHQAAHLRRRGR